MLKRGWNIIIRDYLKHVNVNLTHVNYYSLQHLTVTYNKTTEFKTHLWPTFLNQNRNKIILVFLFGKSKIR